MSHDGASKAKVTASMVEVLTWGTHSEGGNGMTHFIDSTLLGGNVGHASVLVTFPADETGLALIKQYCLKGNQTVLPFERKTMQVLDEAGKLQTQEVFQVYFSWWPSNNPNGFRLQTNPNQDGEQEREGVNVGPRAERFAEADNLESQEVRTARGMLGSKQKNLAPNQISMDLSSLDDNQQKLVQRAQRKNGLKYQMDSMEVIVKKLPENTDNIVIAGTLLNLLQQHFPDWKARLGLADNDPTPRTITAEQATTLRDAMTTKIEQTNAKITVLNGKINAQIMEMEVMSQQAIVDEVTLLAEIYQQLPPVDQRRMLENREAFSVRAWNAFEMVEVQKEKNTLNEFSTFISANYDFQTDANAKEIVLNALFSNQLPEHTELAALQTELPEIEARMQSITREITEKEALLASQADDPENSSSLALEISVLNIEKTALQKKLDRKAHLETPAMQAALNGKLAAITQAFRQHLPRSYHNMTRENISLEAITIAKKSVTDRNVELMMRLMELEAEKPLLKLSDPIIAGDYGRFVSLGLKPDYKTQLPVSGIADGQPFMQNGKALPGLNVERMLAKMRELTEDGIEFDLTTKNCSVTSAAILSAGAEPQLQPYFQRRALGGFGNPQEVFNGALQYQNAIILHDGKIPLSDRITSVNPLNIAGNLAGRMMSSLVDPNLGMPAKVGIGILLPPIALAAGLVETGKALLQPLSTFKRQTQFVDYAFKNNSMVLKALAIPVAIMAGALSPFAGIELGVRKAMIEPIGKIFQKRQRDKALANDPFREPSISDPVMRRHEQRLQTVTGTTPAEVVQNMHAVLNSDPLAIPELDRVAQTILQGKIPQEVRASLLDAQEKVRERVYAFNRAQPQTTVPNESAIVRVETQQQTPAARNEPAEPTQVAERSPPSTPRR